MANRLALISIAALFITACTMPIPIPIPSGAEHKSSDVSAYSKAPKSQADVDEDMRTCRKFATDSTNHDPALAKKWPYTWVESGKELFGRETDQSRWNRYYGTCMKARNYEVN